MGITLSTSHKALCVMRFRGRSAFVSRSGGIVYASPLKAVGASPSLSTPPDPRAFGFSALTQSVLILAWVSSLDE